MRTISLAYFNYSNAATCMLVKATEFHSRVNGTFWRVRVIDGENVKLHCPQSKTAAVQIADEAIAQFVNTLHQIHCKEEA